MTVHENMTKLTDREACARLAGAVVERAIEDVHLMTQNKILVRGKVNTRHRVFRVKNQFDDHGSFQDIRNANPRDAYALLRFFDDELKTWLHAEYGLDSSAKIKRGQQYEEICARLASDSEPPVDREDGGIDGDEEPRDAF